MKASDVLRVAVLRKSGAVAASAGTKPPVPTTPTRPSHVVAKGDILSRIANRSGTSVQQIQKWNPNITNPNKIYPGQQIWLGPEASAPSVAATPTAAPTAAAEVAAPRAQQQPQPAPRTQQQVPTPTNWKPGDPVPTTITPEGLAPFVAQWEGFRAKPYKDSRGLLTVGYGTLLHGQPEAQRWYDSITANGTKPLTAEAAQQRMQADIAAAIANARRLQPGFDRLDPQAQAVVVDMVYNLGPAGFSKFKKTRSAFERGDYTEAAKEMQDSKWYRQVGRRSQHHVPLVASLHQAQGKERG